MKPRHYKPGFENIARHNACIEDRSQSTFTDRAVDVVETKIKKSEQDK